MNTIDDLLAKKNAGIENLNQLLLNQRSDIPQALDVTRNKINAGRDRFFSGTVDPNVQSVQGSLGISPTASPELKALAYSKLGRALSTNLATRGRSMLTSNLTNSFNVGAQNVGDAHTGYLSAKDNAYKAQAQEASQEFQAAEAAKTRESTLKRQGINEQWGALEQGLYDPNYNQFSAGDIALAQLLGLGATVGTAYGLNKYKNSKANQPATTNQPYVAGTGLENYGLNRSTSNTAGVGL